MRLVATVGTILGPQFNIARPSRRLSVLSCNSVLTSLSLACINALIGEGERTDTCGLPAISSWKTVLIVDPPSCLFVPHPCARVVTLRFLQLIEPPLETRHCCSDSVAFGAEPTSHTKH